MKKLFVTDLRNVPADVSLLGSVFDKEKVERHPVSIVNWKDFPYRPEVSFRIAHNGTNILLNFRVEEADVKAVCDKDGGKVWEDSCVEFFISFDQQSYYNIETNCIGSVLVATGKDRHARTPLPESVLKRIKRFSSLGAMPLEKESATWELSLLIPLDVFADTGITDLSGQKATGNFYKCGDNQKTPHFISWNPIGSETPDFHRPEFFGDIYFE